MSGGPFRSPRPASRSAVPASRPVSTAPQSRTPEASTPVESVPEAPLRPIATEPRTRLKQASRFKRLRWWLVGGVLALGLIIAAGFLYLRGAVPGIDDSKYQAVFLSNGDIYFGKLHSAGPGHMKLTNIYYIQSEDTDASGEESQATDQNNVRLIKLGDEIYGPEDMMIISKDQIMLYENLKPDGKVAQAIDSYKSSR